MSKFKIEANGLYWLCGQDDGSEDLCLHGHAVALIGERKLEYADCTVSATALYLLKTLTEDHIIDTDNQLLPCCGHTLIANEDLSNVIISGCPNGIDWSVLHEGDCLRLVLEDGYAVTVPMSQYRAEVYRFADSIEAFYKSSPPRRDPQDEFDRRGYVAFWNEWHRRRGNC